MQLSQRKASICVYLFLIIFYNHGISQSQIGESLYNENLGDLIGERFDMSSNGQYIIATNPISETQSKIITFQFDGGEWVKYGSSIIVPTNKLPPNAPLVKISEDGSSISLVIIDKQSNGADDLDGYIASYFYSSEDNTWKIKGEKIFGDYPFRIDFDMSDDGDKIVVAQTTSGSNFFFDTVITYLYQNNSWVKVQDLNKPTGVFFGFALDLSSDGNTMVVGDYGAEDPNGIIYIYQWSGTSWTETGTIREFVDIAGFVSISGDGNTIATIQHPNTLDTAVEVLVFHYEDGQWTQIGSSITSENETNTFYNCIDLSYNGNRLVVGTREFNSSRTFTTLYEFLE